MLKPEPEQLGAAIKRQRLVPRSVTLPPFSTERLVWDSELEIPNWGLEFIEKPSIEGGILWVSPALVEAKREFEEIVHSLPSGLRRCLREGAKPGEQPGVSLWSSVTVYEEFLAERQVLDSIWRACSKQKLPILIPEVSLYVMEDKSGKKLFELVTHPLYEEIINQEVDPSYIRECKNRKCKSIFWAGRADQAGCCAKCAQAIRDRKHSLTKSEKTRRLTGTGEDKGARILHAIKQGHRTREAISSATGLSLEDEVPELLAKLWAQGQLRPEDGMFTLAAPKKES